MRGVTPLLEQGIDIDSALRGYQLTMITGFCFRYMDLDLCRRFGEAIMGHDGASGH